MYIEEYKYYNNLNFRIMNFIIEILPKKENGNQYVYVVRSQNGFPLAVCESLEGAKDVIQTKHDEMLANFSKSHDL